MANVNCNSCRDLEQLAPNMMVNGISSTECNSLKNDTGLKPSAGHTNCTDLDKMNDCLIGYMGEDAEIQDSCNWQDYIQRLIANLWTMFKAFGCSMCGLWANVHSLWTKVNSYDDDITNLKSTVSTHTTQIGNLQTTVGQHTTDISNLQNAVNTINNTDLVNIWSAINNIDQEVIDVDAITSGLCTLVQNSISPPLTRYGTLPRSSATQHRCGTIRVKHGDELLIDMGLTTGNANEYTTVGFKYASNTVASCNNASVQRVYEYLEPACWGYQLSADAEIGDVLWTCPKTDVQAVCGWSDELWTIFTNEQWTWREFNIIGGAKNHQSVYLRLKCGDADAGISSDYLCLSFQGTGYPNEAPGYNARIGEPSSETRVYSHIAS